MFSKNAPSWMFVRVMNTPLKPFRSHCVKSVRICNYSGRYFPAFGLNTERFSDTPYFSKYGKIATRITPNTDTFHAVSFVEKRVKTKNLLSTFGVETLINKENINNFTKLLFRSKQINLKKSGFYFWQHFFGHP